MGRFDASVGVYFTLENYGRNSVQWRRGCALWKVLGSVVVRATVWDSPCVVVGGGGEACIVFPGRLAIAHAALCSQKGCFAGDSTVLVVMLHKCGQVLVGERISPNT